MNDTAVLSIDIGTTALKAALTGERREGGIIVFASSRIPLVEKDESKAALEWLVALKAALIEMREKTKADFGIYDPFKRLSGICVSGNGPTIVSKNGVTLLWSSPLTVKVSEKCKSLFIPRLLQFREQFPEEWSASDTIFSGPEYLIYRLTSRAVTILPESRYSTAYWDVRSLYEAGFSANEQSKFPACRAPGDCAGVVTAQAAIALDGFLPARTPVFCGAPDFIAGLIGTATLSVGRLCDCAGSSEGINLCTSRAIFAEGIRTLPSVLYGLWNAAVLIPESGVKFAKYKQSVEEREGKSWSYEEFINRVLDEGDEEGKKILVDNAKEVASAVKKLRDAAEKEGIPLKNTIQVTGGQALNPRWMQLKCDIIGLPLTVPSCADAELTGDAVLARYGLGEYESLEDAAESLVRVEREYFPKKV